MKFINLKELLIMNLLELSTKEERINAVKEVVGTSKNVQLNDKEMYFPFEQFDKLIEINYPSKVLPKSVGGLNIGLSELLNHQETIATVDASTALGIGWHMGVASELPTQKNWHETTYEDVVTQIVTKGALINNAASERATGSPTRGGKPQTTARRVPGGWMIKGRKTFTSLAPILTYSVVTATIAETNEVAQFLIRNNKTGVWIDETWDSISMRSTGSHDLVLDDVHVTDLDYIKVEPDNRSRPRGWLLHIPACYLGIAQAAKEEAIQFASSFSPVGVSGTLADLPTVQQKLGRMELQYMQSSEYLYSIARKWDEGNGDERERLANELSVAKITVMNNGIDIVDQAMRIVGARSLSEQHPLQRHYRDIRAGLHNPPMEDVVLTNLAKRAIQKSKERNNEAEV